ncbi:MAG: hypothetical protein PWP46_904 [Fusobacteriaceae bacterium]|jgi:predicted oxidoreductase|nr:hypothetical protein [Fusobacteriaceae bacterium]
MNRIKITNDLSFSQIIHGWWRAEYWNKSLNERIEFVEKCINKGITTFDHADIYGGGIAEELFGEVLKAKPEIREKIEIVTKCGIRFIHPNMPKNDGHYYDTSYEHIMYTVEKSLKGLNTDYIDLLLIHRPDMYMNPEEVNKAFIELKDSGKVKNFGVSNFLPEQFEMLKSYLDVPLVVNQLEISVACYDNFENFAIDNAMKNRTKLMAWSPLAGGKLFTSNEEKYIRLRNALEKVKNEVGANGIDEIAYAWLLNHPANIMPICGSGNFERVQSAINAINIKLTRKQWFKILDASRGFEVA